MNLELRGRTPGATEVPSSAPDAAPRMAVRRLGTGPDLVLFHGGHLDLHRVPRAGHWSAYENAPEVNRLMLEFFSSPQEGS